MFTLERATPERKERRSSWRKFFFIQTISLLLRERARAPERGFLSHYDDVLDSFFFLFFLSLYSFLRISVLLFGVLFFLRRSHSPYLVHLTTDIFSLPANGRVPNFSSPASSSSSLTVTSFTSIRKENGGRKKTRIRTGRSFASAIFVFVLRWSVYNQKKEGRRNNDS